MVEIRHYCTPAGRQPVREFISGLPEESRTEVLILLRRLENGEVLGMPQSRSMASMAPGLFELRVSDRQGEVRIFYYIRIRGAVYLVHAVRKRGRTIARNDRVLILKRMQQLRRIA